MTNVKGRVADHPIDPRFLERWSPRSFSGEPITDDAGAAWGYLALQASLSGLAAHAMVGFDMDTAFSKL